MKTLVAAFFIALTISAFAASRTITTKNGIVYKNAEIVSHNATTAKISHDDGITTVGIDELPDYIQKELNFVSPQENLSAAPNIGPDPETLRQLQSQAMWKNGMWWRAKALALPPNDRYHPPWTIKDINTRYQQVLKEMIQAWVVEEQKKWAEEDRKRRQADQK